MASRPEQNMCPPVYESLLASGAGDHFGGHCRLLVLKIPLVGLSITVRPRTRLGSRSETQTRPGLRSCFFTTTLLLT